MCPTSFHRRAGQAPHPALPYHCTELLSVCPITRCHPHSAPLLPQSLPHCTAWPYQSHRPSIPRSTLAAQSQVSRRTSPKRAADRLGIAGSVKCSVTRQFRTHALPTLFHHSPPCCFPRMQDGPAACTSCYTWLRHIPLLATHEPQLVPIDLCIWSIC